MNAPFRSRFFTFVLLVACLFSLAHATDYGEIPANDEVDIGIFQDALAPYGNWVEHSDYGRVWYPTQVSSGWRPYTDGHWEYTADYGWLWVSDQVWGWAPFHYGRWAWDDGYGWVWIPGRVWAPAWVFWRYGGGYTAWAPMPPTVVWQPGVGAETRYFDRDRDLDRDCWVAVRDRDVHNRYLGNTIIDPGRNHEVMRFADRYSEPRQHDRFIVNRGVPLQHIERAGGRRVQPVRLRELADPFARPRHDHGRRELEVVRPRFRDSADAVRDEEARAERLARIAMMRPRSDTERNQRRGGGEQGFRIPDRFRKRATPENHLIPRGAAFGPDEDPRGVPHSPASRPQGHERIPGALPDVPRDRDGQHERPRVGEERTHPRDFPQQEPGAERWRRTAPDAVDGAQEWRRQAPRSQTLRQEPDAAQQPEDRLQHRLERQRQEARALEQQQRQMRERQDEELRRQSEAQRRRDESRQQEIQRRRESARQLERQQQMELQHRQREQIQQQRMLQERESARRGEFQRQQFLEAQRRQEQEMQRREQLRQQQYSDMPGSQRGEGRRHGRDRMDQR